MKNHQARRNWAILHLISKAMGKDKFSMLADLTIALAVFRCACFAGVGPAIAPRTLPWCFIETLEESNVSGLDSAGKPQSEAASLALTVG